MLLILLLVYILVEVFIIVVRLLYRIQVYNRDSMNGIVINRFIRITLIIVL